MTEDKKQEKGKIIKKIQEFEYIQKKEKGIPERKRFGVFDDNKKDPKDSGGKNKG